MDPMQHMAGLVLGNLVSYPGPHLSKGLLFLVVLPGLLFEAAYQMHFAEFWRARLSILTLAVPGLLIATFLTASLVSPFGFQFFPHSDISIEHRRRGPVQREGRSKFDRFRG